MKPLTLHIEQRLESFECDCELCYRVSVGFVSLQVEDAVNDGIHTTVGASEQVQALLQHDIRFFRFFGIHEEPLGMEKLDREEKKRLKTFATSRCERRLPCNHHIVRRPANDENDDCSR